MTSAADGTRTVALTKTPSVAREMARMGGRWAKNLLRIDSDVAIMLGWFIGHGLVGAGLGVLLLGPLEGMAIGLITGLPTGAVALGIYVWHDEAKRNLGLK